LVVGPAALRSRWFEGLPKKEAIALATSRKALTSFEYAEGTAWVLKGGNHTVWIPIDDDCGMLVRRIDYLDGRRLADLFDLDLSWFEGPWKKLGTMELAAGAELFDSVAPPIAKPPTNRARLEKARETERCHEYVPLGLAAGRYTLHSCKTHISVSSRDIGVSAIRVVREGRSMPRLTPVPRREKPEPITITKDAVRAAKAMRFVETDGGPFVLVHETDLKRWWGVFDQDAEPVDEPADADYWRACLSDVGLVEGQRGIEVLSVPGPVGHAFVRTRNGGLFIGWQGADTAAGCLAAVKAQPEDVWEDIGGTWRARGPARLIDANRDGRALDRERWLAVDLPAATYVVETMSFLGQARHPQGAVEDLSVSAVRFRPLAPSPR